MLLRLISLLVLCSISLPGAAQPTAILLDNPSFEDLPMPARPPKGWYYCGTSGETPPDIHPLKIYGEVPGPADGSTYVGMVARDNQTWEAIGQQLASPLRAGQCYRFQLSAACSRNYRSISRMTAKPVNYDMPLRLRIYGANQNCDQRILLASSAPVQSSEWKAYRFLLQPQQDFTHLILEAFYTTDEVSYNGNLLLDQSSALLPVDCHTQTPTVEIDQLQLPTFPSLDSLRTFVAQHGQRICFRPGGQELENHLFLDERQIERQFNKHLWLVAKAMRRFPKRQLQIRVAGPHAKERIQYLYRALVQLNLPETQYELKVFKKRDQGKDWLWKSNRQGLYMNVI